MNYNEQDERGEKILKTLKRCNEDSFHNSALYEDLNK